MGVRPEQQVEVVVLPPGAARATDLQILLLARTARLEGMDGDARRGEAVTLLAPPSAFVLASLVVS